QLFFSIPILLAAAGLHGELYVPAATPLAWASVAYQAVVVSFMSYLTWFWLISRYPAGRLAAFTFLTPLLGVIAAALILGEQVTPMLLVGLVCVGIGLRLVNRH
ncbi:MAG: DMT family transporter, partial [Acetobacteraceae bacterium]|nr:DMT family transporter [Acetobacteraceae bacterium]